MKKLHREAVRTRTGTGTGTGRPSRRLPPLLLALSFGLLLRLSGAFPGKNSHRNNRNNNSNSNNHSRKKKFGLPPPTAPSPSPSSAANYHKANNKDGSVAVDGGFGSQLPRSPAAAADDDEVAAAAAAHHHHVRKPPKSFVLPVLSCIPNRLPLLPGQEFAIRDLTPIQRATIEHALREHAAQDPSSSPQSRHGLPPRCSRKIAAGSAPMMALLDDYTKTRNINSGDDDGGSLSPEEGPRYATLVALRAAASAEAHQRNNECSAVDHFRLLRQWGSGTVQSVQFVAVGRIELEGFRYYQQAPPPPSSFGGETGDGDGEDVDGEMIFHDDDDDDEGWVDTGDDATALGLLEAPQSSVPPDRLSGRSPTTSNDNNIMVANCTLLEDNDNYHPVGPPPEKQQQQQQQQRKLQQAKPSSSSSSSRRRVHRSAVQDMHRHATLLHHLHGERRMWVNRLHAAYARLEEGYAAAAKNSGGGAADMLDDCDGIGEIFRQQQQQWADEESPEERRKWAKGLQAARAWLRNIEIDDEELVDHDGIGLLFPQHDGGDTESAAHLQEEEEFDEGEGIPWWEHGLVPSVTVSPRDQYFSALEAMAEQKRIEQKDHDGIGEIFFEDAEETFRERKRWKDSLREARAWLEKREAIGETLMDHDGIGLLFQERGDIRHQEILKEQYENLEGFHDSLVEEGTEEEDIHEQRGELTDQNNVIRAVLGTEDEKALPDDVGQDDDNEDVSLAASRDNFGLGYVTTSVASLSDVTKLWLDSNLSPFYSPQHRAKEEAYYETLSFVSMYSLQAFLEPTHLSWALQCTDTARRLQACVEWMRSHVEQLEEEAMELSMQLKECGLEYEDLTKRKGSMHIKF